MISTYGINYSDIFVIICTSGDVSGNIHRALRPFICSSHHVVLVIKQANKKIASNIARSYYMVSEVNQKPWKHGFKRHRMPGYAVGRRQPERKLAAFQATHRADVYRTSQNPEQKRRNEAIFLSGSDRKEGISTTRGVTSPTMTVRN